MTKRKTVRKLEALMEALEASKPVCVHNPVETEMIIDRIIGYQCEYKKITGHYYSMKKRDSPEGHHGRD